MVFQRHQVEQGLPQNEVLGEFATLEISLGYLAAVGHVCGLAFFAVGQEEVIEDIQKHHALAAKYGYVNLLLKMKMDEIHVAKCNDVRVEKS